MVNRREREDAEFTQSVFPILANPCKQKKTLKKQENTVS